MAKKIIICILAAFMVFFFVLIFFFNTRKTIRDQKQIDSFSYNWAMNNHIFKGVRLYPYMEDSLSAMKAIERGVLLVMKIGDTLTVLSNEEKIFNTPIRNFNKKEIQDFYTNYHIDFDNDLPIGAYVTNEKDSLVYYKGIDSESSYSLVYGNIKSNSLSLAQLSIGNDITRLLEKYAIPDIKDTRCKYVAIIPIDCIGRAWYKKFNIPIKRIPFSTLVIFLTLHNGKISHVIFTNNGVAGLIE